MKEIIQTVTLEDGIEYIILDEIESFMYLANIDDETDFCIRKIKTEQGQEILVGLDSDEEFDNALKLYYKKNQEK